MSSDAEPRVPTRFGRYKIEKQLGKGAMGVVYLAEDTQLGRRVALKIPKKSSLVRPESLERFYREARTTATLRHNNICPVYDVGEIDGIHYLTMAYIPGKPVSSFLGKKPPPSKQVALLIRKIALALDEAHRNGVVHRDLKPSNVMLDDRGEPIVMDFGLAFNANTEEDARLTHSGMILGTPAYMAPEQVRGEVRSVGPQSDIYALGVMLYQFLTGELPFSGPVLLVLQQILGELSKRPSDLQPDVDPALEVICLKMMEKDPTQRFGTMKDVANALTNYLKSGSGTGWESKSISNASGSIPESDQGTDPDSSLTGFDADPVSGGSTWTSVLSLLSSIRYQPRWVTAGATVIGIVLFGWLLTTFWPFGVTHSQSSSPPLKNPASESQAAETAHDASGSEAALDGPPRVFFLPEGTVYVGDTRSFHPDIDLSDRASEFQFTVTIRDGNRIEARAELSATHRSLEFHGFCVDKGNGEGLILIQDIEAIGETDVEDRIPTMVVKILQQGSVMQGVSFLGTMWTDYSGTIQTRGGAVAEETGRPVPSNMNRFRPGDIYYGTTTGYPPGSDIPRLTRPITFLIERREGTTVEVRLHLSEPEEDWQLIGDIVSRKVPTLVIQDVDLIGADHPLEGNTTLIVELSEDAADLTCHGYSTLGNRLVSQATRMAHEMKVRVWKKPDGYFISGFNRDWFEKWQDGKVLPNHYVEVEENDEYIELLSPREAVRWRLYADRSQILDERRGPSTWSPATSGKWVENLTINDESRHLWKEPNGYFLRGLDGEWFQKYGDATRARPNLFRQQSLDNEIEYVELRHCLIPYLYRIYSDRAMRLDERKSETEYEFAYEGEWER